MNEAGSQRDAEGQKAINHEHPGPSRSRRRRRGRGGGSGGEQAEAGLVARLQQSGLLPVLPLIAGGVLLCILLYTVRIALAPPVLGLLILYLLYPYRQSRLVVRIMVMAGLVLLIWFVIDSGRVLFPFVIAFVLAYLFNPIATRLERWGVPRVWAVLLLLAVFVGLAALAIVFIGPRVLDQLADLIRRLPTSMDRLSSWLEGPVLNSIAKTFGLGSADEIRALLFQGLADQWQAIAQQGLKTFGRLLSGFATVVGALSRVLELIAIPFVTFYLLKDFVAVQTRMVSLIPVRHRGSVMQTVLEIDDLISRYIRGQFLVCLIVGVLTGFSLTLIGLDYALILGIITGVLNLIPYFGFIISVGLAILVALFDPMPLIMILKVVATYIGLNIIESSVITPRIVGHHVGLHPVWVIFALLIFFHFFGFIGLLIAVPTAAVISLFIRRWYRWYVESPLYNRP